MHTHGLVVGAPRWGICSQRSATIRRRELLGHTTRRWIEVRACSRRAIRAAAHNRSGNIRTNGRCCRLIRSVSDNCLSYSDHVGDHRHNAGEHLWYGARLFRRRALSKPSALTTQPASSRCYCPSCSLLWYRNGSAMCLSSIVSPALDDKGSRKESLPRK